MNCHPKSSSSKECKFIKRKQSNNEGKSSAKKKKSNKEWNSFAKTIQNCIWSCWNKSSSWCHKKRKNTKEWKPKWPTEKASTIKRKCKLLQGWPKNSSMRKSLKRKRNLKNWDNKKMKSDSVILMWWKQSWEKSTLSTQIRRMTITSIQPISCFFWASLSSAIKFTSSHNWLVSTRWM